MRGARQPKPKPPGKRKGGSRKPRPLSQTALRAQLLRAEAARKGHQGRRIRKRRHAAASKLGAWRKQRAAGDPRAETVRALGGRAKATKPKRKGELPRFSVVVDDLPFGLSPAELGEIAEQAGFEVRAQVDELGAKAWRGYRFQFTLWKLHSRFDSPDEVPEGEQEWSRQPVVVSSSYRQWPAFISTIAPHTERSAAPRETDASRRIWVYRIAAYGIPFRR